MRRRAIFAVIPLAFVAVTFALALSIGGSATAGADLERYIVRVDSLDAADAVIAEVRGLGGRHVETLRYVPNTIVVALAPQAADALADRAGVVYVERDELMHLVHHQCGHDGGPPGSPPPDCPDPTPSPTEGPAPTQTPAPGSQEIPWGIDQIHAPDAWTVAKGSGVRVCIADTGIDPDHEDLPAPAAARNFAGGGPFSTADPSKWQDGNGHGSHVAGTVAALDNDIGVVGVAPDASLVVAKVLKDSGSGWISQIADGIAWCASEADANVINMSFGGGDSATLAGAIADAAASGVVLVAASGNDGASQPGFPARYPDVIAVGATDSTDAQASWSNDGEEVLAPGVSIHSTVPGGYDTYSGTSMASPHAAGTAALIIASGTTDPDTVRSTLKSTADSIADGDRINAARAVGAIAYRMTGGVLLAA